MPIRVRFNIAVLEALNGPDQVSAGLRARWENVFPLVPDHVGYSDMMGRMQLGLRSGKDKFSRQPPAVAEARKRRAEAWLQKLRA